MGWEAARVARAIGRQWGGAAPASARGGREGQWSGGGSRRGREARAPKREAEVSHELEPLARGRIGEVEMRILGHLQQFRQLLSIYHI